MRSWVGATRREYDAPVGTATPGETFPSPASEPRTRTYRYRKLISMRAQWTVADQRGGLVTIEERLDLSVAAVAAVILAALLAAVGGVWAARMNASGPSVMIAFLLVSAVPAFVADAYVSLRADAHDSVNGVVLRRTSMPLHYWVGAVSITVVAMAFTPNRWRIAVAAMLVVVALTPLIPPLRWAGTSITRWLDSWTVISESVGKFSLAAGVVGRSGVKERIHAIEKTTEMDMVPDADDRFLGTWQTDSIHCRYTLDFDETVPEDGDGAGAEADEEIVTTVTQRVAVRRGVRAFHRLVLPVGMLGLVYVGWLTVEAGWFEGVRARVAAGTVETTSLESLGEVLSLLNNLLLVFLVFLVYVALVTPSWLRLDRRPNLVNRAKRKDDIDVDSDPEDDLAAGYLHVDTDVHTIFGGMAAGCLAFGVFRSMPGLVLLAGVAAVVQIAVVALGIADGRPLLWVRRRVALLVGGTPITARYARVMAYTLLPLVAIAGAQAALGETFAAAPVPGMDAAVSAIIVLYAGFVLVRVGDEEAFAARHAIRQKRTTPATVAVGFIAVLGCSLATYAAVVYVLDWFVLDLGVAVGPFPAFRRSSLTATLVFLVVPAGALAQSLWGVASRLVPESNTSGPANATRLDTDTADRVDAPVYVVDTDDAVSEAVDSFTGPAHIAVSSGVIDTLETDELIALLTHEQAHIDHGDTVLGLILPVIGTALLTGQNVLFDLFDVAEREHQADIAAAERTDDPEAVIAALEELDDVSERFETTHTSTGAFGGVLLRRAATRGRGLMVRAFDLFFGTSALTAIHPSIEDRRRRLKSAFEYQSEGTATAADGPRTTDAPNN